MAAEEQIKFKKSQPNNFSLMLSGMPRDSPFDAEYCTDVGDVARGVFVGRTNSRINFNATSKTWKLELVQDPSTFALSDENPEPPLGTHWFHPSKVRLSIATGRVNVTRESTHKT